MAPLFQLFQKGSTSDSYYNQCAVHEFLVAVKEMVGNIHKRLSNIYGIAAVSSSTVGHWAKRVRDVEVAKTQLLDVMQRGMTFNSDIYTSTLKKMRRCFQCVQPDKNLCKMLLQHNNTWPYTSIKTQEAITLLDEWYYLIDPIAPTQHLHIFTSSDS